jgi:acetyl-CoA carboxylase carboxyltransferase component
VKECTLTMADVPLGVVVKWDTSKENNVLSSNDATVKQVLGSQLLLRKIFAQEIAMENRLPIIYLVDSAGVYLPLQDEIFPDKEHFGRIFRNNPNE